MLRRIALLFLGFLVVSNFAFAQQGTADLRGRVSDQQGAVLPGVTIVVRHQESGLFRETITGADGTFLMSGMTPGMYEVSAELASFKKYTQRDVRLEVGRTTPVELKLEVGGLTEAVTVTSEAPLVDTTTQEIGGRISQQEFVDTPSFNRNFAGYLGMLPGVVATISATTFGADSISVAGQNVRNVNYTMDGSNNNDTFNGGNGGAQARVPVEAVQEFQLLSSQFDAEYGLTSGGVVNSVSKSGTNRLRGAAFVFFQDEKMSSLEYFAKKEGLEEAPSKQQQFGGVLGGPIIRDKAHFFGSVERILLDSSVTTNIPTRPDLNRTDVEISRVWNTYLRGDHQINQGNTWGLRWLRETSPQPLQIQATNHTPSRHEAETDVDWTVVGNLSSVIGSTKVNTFRVSAVSEDVFFGNPLFNEGQPQESLLPQLNYLSFQDQQSARANRRLDVAYGADNVFAWFLPGKGGDHDMKFGINYLYSSLRVQDFGNENGIFTMNIDVAFNRSDPRTYPERLVGARAGPGRLPDGWALHRPVRAGSLEAEQQPDDQLRRALRHRDPADTEPGEPDVCGRSGRLSDGSQQHRAASRLRVVARRAGPVGAPRRRRRVLSANGVYVPDQHVFERPFLGFVHGELPDQHLRSRSAAGEPADRSDAAQRPGRESRVAQRASSRRERESTMAARCASTTPIASTLIRAPTASATSGRSGR